MTDGEAGTLASGTGTVTPERFARVRAIFEAALDQPARDRLAFVKGACVGDAVLLREVEAMLAADATGAPLLDRPASTPSSSAPEEGRFPAGTVLAGRYRILGRLGQGGMGEVYRAHDLILNQTVALKFLAPAHLSEAALARFRNEVRIARQVSHPNVCRVYDLGMVEGLHFLSMEYIDGEDLASLLRRIGRLPQDKAIEFTRKICAGLGAAHERGVLHRDLKPANIMIDGRGQPRITDFGLAGLAAEIPLSDLRSGTPAYMSPEQKAGKDVTVRSDLYSLGLVLHEMFTGKARKDTQSNPSELVKDLDPAIERLILRCLEEDPKRRPTSALNVVMALPGADPIAAALAAGETPSPEMVAASQEKEGFSNRTAILLFTAVALLVLPAAWSVSLVSLLDTARIDIPPDALAYRAQQILGGFGYTETPPYTAYGFDCCDAQNFDDVVRMGQRRANPILATHQPPILRFWYRQHRHPIVPAVYTVDYNAPSNDEPGMVRLALDARGHLIRLEVRPEAQIGAGSTTPDEAELFKAAGLDRARFQATAPRTVPPMASDARLAWIGTYRDDPADPVRVEAAWWEGRPVYLNVAGDRQRPDGRQDAQPAAQPFVNALAAVLALLGASLAAAHNLRLGRGDRRGAAFVGWVLFLNGLGLFVLEGTHALSFAALTNSMIWLCVAISGGVFAWLAYIAIEPFVRRQTPDALISWTRARSGHLRDPLVAAHVLVGIAVMLVNVLVGNLVMRFGAGVWVLPPPSALLQPLASSAEFAARLLGSAMFTFVITFQLLLLTLVFRVIVRRAWIADIVACAVIGALGLYAYTGVLGFAMNTLFMLVVLALVRRFGYLSMLSAWWTYAVIFGLPFSLDSWYTGRLLVALALPVMVSAWALWVMLSDRRQLSLESAS